MLEAARRLEEDHAAEVEANRAYEHYRATGRDKRGRRLSSHPPKPYQPPEQPDGVINTTDPDSRVMKTVGQPGKQGYNAQPAVNENQVIVAAEATVVSPDAGKLEPMFQAAERELKATGVDEQPGVSLPILPIGTPCRWRTSSVAGRRC